MDNTLNGRTPEEIKKGLECCTGKWSCESCPYNLFEDADMCNGQPATDALALIQQLERERDAWEDRVVELCKMAGRLERERDAMAKDMKTIVYGLKCEVCLNKGNKSACDDCDVHTFCNWQWRGVQEVE